MSPKKLYIDITSFFSVDFMTGIQRVVRELVTRLLKMTEFDVTLFVWPNEKEKLSVLSNDDFLKCYDDGCLKKSQINFLEELVIESIEPGSIFFDIDAVWNGNCHQRIDVFSKLSKQGVLIATYIYDVIPITNPEFFSRTVPGVGFYSYVAANLCCADMLITSVHATEDRLKTLANRFATPTPRCSVSWLGSDFKVKRTDSVVSQKAKDVASRGKYVLCVGTLEPRKNHTIVLDAYEKKLSELGVNLVFAGKRGWGVDKLLCRIDNHPKKDNGLFLLEGENDATIDFLYKNAWVVAFPTFDEGFGLPLVEALLNGCVCVVSDIPVMREVGGNFCDYVDPNSSELLANLFLNYLEKPEIYEDCKRRSSEFKPFLWDDVAKRIKSDLLCLQKHDIIKNEIDVINVKNCICECLEKKLYLLEDFKALPLIKEERIPKRGLRNFLKRIIRKCLRFYVSPIVRDFNRCISLQNEMLQKQNCLIKDLINGISRLEDFKLS